jgi:hypothetical protein
MGSFAFTQTSPNQESNNLVGGAITILKHMKVNGKDDTTHKLWKIKNV